MTPDEEFALFKQARNRLVAVAKEAAERDQKIPRQNAIGAYYAFNDALANEMIRQMEWVRDQCSEQIGGAAEDSDERVWDMKLTLAPDDWKPR